MTDILTTLSKRFSAAIKIVYGDEHSNINPLINVTSNPDFGDYQANLAMSLAKKLGDKPRNIASAIVARLALEDICEKIEIAGPGFINLYLSQTFIDEQLRSIAEDKRLGVKLVALPQTVVVDYSAPNVAKEMHVGHLRSTVIGDAMVRVLMIQGHKVIRQNHMGDWGTQFGMLIEYLIDSDWDEKKSDSSISDLNLLYQESKQKFDSDTDFNERARNRVVALQGGDEYTLRIWQYLVKESIKHFNQIYHRLGVLLTEADNCPESFYNPRLPEIVKDLQQSHILEMSEGAAVIFLDGFKDRDEKPLPMIVRKSDGGYLYATTDLAALRYRLDELRAERIIYITDARQSQHFAMLFAAVRRAGWVSENVRLDHMPFGSVLGANRKPYKTRDGGTIKLSDLLDEAEIRVDAAIENKNPELSEVERSEVARIISLAALKYADLSNDRIKDYVFDWDRMLALDGNTAPYLLNAYVRIVSIFRKGKIDRQSIDNGALRIRAPSEKALALKLYQYSSAVEAVAERLEPHRLCTYLYELASSFHSFYESCPILKEDVGEDERRSRLALCDLCARVIHDGLGLLGIETVEQM
ncbi:MAG: arginyl-tRNA synthetase [Planctomycetota bacterium]|jgi:arginyl-tRNA synthetase